MEIKYCIECDKPFKPHKDNPQQDYCSDKCWEKANNAEKR